VYDYQTDRCTWRGGGWNNQSINLRASNRNNNTPDNHNNNVGLRLAHAPGLPGQMPHCNRIAVQSGSACMRRVPALIRVGFTRPKNTVPRQGQ
jgi:hypothetical protein